PVRVRGLVVDADSGVGVAGVGVQYAPSELTTPDRLDPQTLATSHAAGQFELAVPQGPGVVRLLAATPHGTYDVPGASRWRNKTAIFPEHFVKIDAGKRQPVQVRLTVGRGLVFRGQAIDENGAPVVGAVVRGL